MLPSLRLEKAFFCQKGSCSQRRPSQIFGLEAKHPCPKSHLMKRAIFSLIVLLICISAGQAQLRKTRTVPYSMKYFNPDLSNLTFHGGMGFGAYFGDLSHVYDFNLNNNTLNFNWNIGFAYQYTHYISMRIEANSFKLESKDRVADRDFSFSTTNTEFCVQFVHSLFPKGSIDTRKRRWNPYAFIGFGIGAINAPTVEGEYYGITGTEDTQSNRVAPVWPFGIGVNYYLYSNISLGFDVGFRQSTSDYIDGVSKRANPGFPSVDGYLLYGLRVRWSRSYAFNYKNYSKRHKKIKY